jgi:cytochrome c oxidase assembly factor CtaG
MLRVSDPKMAEILILMLVLEPLLILARTFVIVAAGIGIAAAQTTGV